jgi:hypothetical protein
MIQNSLQIWWFDFLTLSYEAANNHRIIWERKGVAVSKQFDEVVALALQ